MKLVYWFSSAVQIHFVTLSPIHSIKCINKLTVIFLSLSFSPSIAHSLVRCERGALNFTLCTIETLSALSTFILMKNNKYRQNWNGFVNWLQHRHWMSLWVSVELQEAHGMIKFNQFTECDWTNNNAITIAWMYKRMQTHTHTYMREYWHALKWEKLIENHRNASFSNGPYRIISKVFEVVLYKESTLFLLFWTVLVHLVHNGNSMKNSRIQLNLIICWIPKSLAAIISNAW